MFNRLIPRCVSLKCVSSTNYIRTFAGHNKWSKIKRKKGVKDNARAARWGKASKAIENASRACGGDKTHLSLQAAISAAKNVQLPKEKINDALERGIKSKNLEESSSYETMRYDGMIQTSSGKVATVITALTDNRNRTAANVRAIFRKNGGELLPTGANDWIFENLSVVNVPRTSEWGDSEDEILIERALQGGAIDIASDGDNDFLVKCDLSDLKDVLQSLNRDNTFSGVSFELSAFFVRDREMLISLDDESSNFFGNVLDKFDEDEDIENIFHNAS